MTNPLDSAAILASVGAPVVVYDREFRFVYANAPFCASVRKSWHELEGRRVIDVFPDDPERMDAVGLRLQKVFAGEEARSPEQLYHIPGPDGRPLARYWRTTEKPVFGPQGQVTHIVQTGEDITEEISLRRQKEAVASELEHRVRNTLAMVGSLAMITGQHTQSVEAFVDSFTSRLEAMSRNLSMISNNHWEGLAFRDILDAELARVVPPGDPRVSIEGPDVVLSVLATKWAALLIHEMVTNAVRHGCFSVPGGQLQVRWGIEGDAFGAEWIETGRKGRGEPEHKGFGTQMLSLVPAISAERVFHDQGMSLRISVTTNSTRWRSGPVSG
jgi:PAS domain S-box-containing protein